MIVGPILVDVKSRIIIIFIDRSSGPFEVYLSCDNIPSSHLVCAIESYKFVVYHSGCQVKVSFMHAHKEDWISVEDRQNFQIIKRTLVNESLVYHAEINQTLAAHLNWCKLVAQIIFFRIWDEVPQIIDAETRPNILLLSFLRQCVEIVEVRKK